MKKSLLFASLVVCLAFSFPKKSRVIFFGDSITEAGVKPGGYITRVQELCNTAGKGDGYEFLGAGIGGNKVYDLYLRMDDDVLAKNPDVVVIYVGVNDVWHKSSYGTGTDADKFEKFYRAILKRLKDKNIKAIVVTPAVIGEKTDFSNAQDGDLNQYSNVIRKIAKDANVPLVDLRQIFLDYNKANNPTNKDRDILTTDRVHLNEKGNEVVAEAMWKAISSL